MIDFALFLLVPIGYILTGYFIIRAIRRGSVGWKAQFRIVVLSSVYSLFLGIGIWGGGGDPGFALPCPILGVIISDLLDWPGVILFANGAIIPFMFWWMVFYIIMTIKSYLSAKRKKAIDAGLRNSEA